jgi:4-hydroxybenzoate polyprenyltransferase
MTGQLGFALVRSVRPHQWISNLVIFAPLVFSDNLFEPARLLTVSTGFLLLCGLSSVTYLVNDVVDLERDRAHPVRGQRPVAAGELPVNHATAVAVALAVVSLTGALWLHSGFGWAAASYLLVMLGYTLWLRRFAVLDAMTIAGGLVLRAVAGALVIQVTISPWLYLSVGGLGLLLALGRIQYEMRLAQTSGTLESGKYTLDAVAWMNSVTTAVTLIVYCLYTFLATDLPSTYGMMLTIPFVIYGLFRFRHLASQHDAEQSPERLMLSDRSLLVAVGLWVLAVVAVQYLPSLL